MKKILLYDQARLEVLHWLLGLYLGCFPVGITSRNSNHFIAEHCGNKVQQS